MNELERKLREQGKVFRAMEVPEELEGRLQNALRERRKRKAPYGKGLVSVAAILCLLIFTGYHFDTLAYYGKRLMGYDQVMDLTLKNLNELGQGQSIDQSYTFKNGLKVTVDGIMVDDNQLLLFYTLKAPEGKPELLEKSLTLAMEGFFGWYSPRSGEGILDEANGELKWKQSFEPPKALERKLTLELTLLDETVERAEITFPLDREKAMGHTMKRSLNQRVDIEGVRLNFENLIASPTQTKIQGTFHFGSNPVESLMDRGSRANNISGLEVSMVVNGQVYSQRTAGIRSDLKGYSFELTYEALPENLETLEFMVNSLYVERKVEHQVSIVPGEAQSFEVLGKEIDLQEIQEKDGELWITFQTLEGVRLSSVKLLVDGVAVDIQETHSEDWIKTQEGEIYLKRTMVFPAQGKHYQLMIERIRFLETVESGFSVPIK